MDSQRLSSPEVLYQKILGTYPLDDQTLKLLTALITGSMSAAAVASPILFELRGLWFVDMLIFFPTWVAFMLQHGEELKTYGPFTLVFATFLGLSAYASSQTSLPELVPWLPLSVLLFMLLTVYFLPKVHQLLDLSNTSQPGRSMEEGRSTEFRMLSTEQTSVQSDGSAYQMQDIDINQWRSHAVAGMDRRSATSTSRQSSISGSEINLNEHVELAQFVQRMVRLNQEGLMIDGLPQDIPRAGWNLELLNDGPFTNSRGPREVQTRSQSLEDSIAVNQPPSTTGGSETLLLG